MAVSTLIRQEFIDIIIIFFFNKVKFTIRIPRDPPCAKLTNNIIYYIYIDLSHWGLVLVTQTVILHTCSSLTQSVYFIVNRPASYYCDIERNNFCNNFFLYIHILICSILRHCLVHDKIRLNISLYVSTLTLFCFLIFDTLHSSISLR
jgi:hypothetical protein